MKGILTDTTKCIGCRECVLACKATYDLGAELPSRWILDDGLSALNWTSIVEAEEGKFVRKQCRHCIEPACVSVCPVAALTKTSEGAVIYDGDICMGCRYCMMACPYGIPRYDWNSRVPTVRKCILCADKIKEGKLPSCVEACPTGATIFGEREELLAEAHRRIEKYPNRYKPLVYGEKEVGGNAVLYISDTDLSFLTYGSALPEEAMPTRTAPAMHAVPIVFVGMGATMAGLKWIIDRRNKKNGGGDSHSGGN
ncbi:4Fe-4S dicluster domain-containing protein [Calditrichota bacterium]